MQIKIIATYYLLSGLICMAYAHKNYDKIINAMPIMDIFSKEAILIIHFFTGFFQFPLLVAIKIYGLPIEYRIHKLTKKNKKLKEQTEIVKYVSEKFIEVIKQSEELFILQGYIPYIIYLFTDKQKEIKIAVNCKTEEDEQNAFKQVAEICYVENAIAIAVVSEGSIKVEGGTKQAIIIDFESSWFTQNFTIDIDKDKKTIGEKYRSELKSYFLPYLKNIFK